MSANTANTANEAGKLSDQQQRPEPRAANPYAGKKKTKSFATVMAVEQRVIGFKTNEAIGLALSGGGIRSASFALGVVQALERAGVLDKFHYLSTVSGGGYLGAAIQWLRFQFPGGWVQQLGHRKRGAREIKGATKQEFNWFDFFRQHGNYLQPSKIGSLALVGVALRGALVSVLLYFSLLVLLALIPYGLRVWHDAPSADYLSVHLRRWLGYSTAAVVVVVALNYSFATYVAGRPRPAQIRIGRSCMVLALVGIGCAPWWNQLMSANASIPCVVALGTLALVNSKIVREIATSVDTTWPYRIRVQLQQQLGSLLAACIVVALVCWLPGIHEWVRQHSLKAIPTADLLGIAGAAYQSFLGRSKSNAVSGVLGEVRLLATILVLLLGMALSAYSLAGMLYTELLQNGWWAFAAITVTSAGLAALMWFTNLNLFNLGRMYRDRLMETFLPDPDAVKKNEWGLADMAEGDVLPKVGEPTPKDCGLMSAMWPPADSNPRSLYPIFNTNAVLVDATADRFRGRGGDSFILTPLYCGSDATKLAKTSDFAEGTLTLATAMAVSGAAVNPNGAPDGRGISRNRLVAFLMFLVQARLGCWFLNPNRNLDPKKSWREWLLKPKTPNFICPGIQGGLLGRGSNEKALFIELCDGGHFENLGVYELIRRRCRLIVVSAGGADPDYQMEDLGNMIEKVRVDFGVGFDFDAVYKIDDLRPKRPEHKGTPPFAERGFAIAKILYPPLPKKKPDEVAGETPCELPPKKKPEEEPKDCWLLYLQATPIKSVTEDVMTYQRLFPDFPNHTTGDQFFDEHDVESYRELGWAISKEALEAVGFARVLAEKGAAQISASAGIAQIGVGKILGAQVVRP